MIDRTQRRVRAAFDERRVVVWQAHTDEIADYALANGRFGGAAWRRDRVTRFRLSLGSLLGRTEWAKRPGRERVLAVSLAREGFEALLRQSAHAEFEPGLYASRAAWRLATRYAPVSVAWHPDVDEHGRDLPTETLRIGVRDAALRRFTEEYVVGVEDWTPWVGRHRADGGPLPTLVEYPLAAPQLRILAGLPADEVP